ncbi:hypothetical protein ACJX0J_033390, partial [Zea mays]
QALDMSHNLEVQPLKERNANLCMTVAPPRGATGLLLWLGFEDYLSGFSCHLILIALNIIDGIIFVIYVQQDTSNFALVIIIIHAGSLDTNANYM